MNNIGDKILQEIKDNKISPIPRWTFLMKDSFLWLVFLLSLILGGLAMAVIIYIIRNNDLDLYDEMGHSILGFILLTLPYFWLIFILIFILIANYNFRYTPIGYRYHIFYILIASIIISILLGIIFDNLSAAKKMEQLFSDRVPFYNNLVNRGENRWTRPEMGLIGGTIIVFDPLQEIKLKDFNGQIWEIATSSAYFHICRIRGCLKLQTGMIVKVVGDLVEGNQFEAYDIRPWLISSGR